MWIPTFPHLTLCFIIFFAIIYKMGIMLYWGLFSCWRPYKWISFATAFANTFVDQLLLWWRHPAMPQNCSGTAQETWQWATKALSHLSNSSIQLSICGIRQNNPNPWGPHIKTYKIQKFTMPSTTGHPRCPISIHWCIRAVCRVETDHTILGRWF